MDIEFAVNIKEKIVLYKKSTECVSIRNLKDVSIIVKIRLLSITKLLKTLKFVTKTIIYIIIW